MFAVKTSGTVSSSGSITGGLVGQAGFVFNCYSTANVTGTTRTGGLVGEMVGDSHRNYLFRSYATGSVTGTGPVGGLVGRQTASLIRDSYSTGSVNGTAGSTQVRRLVGQVASSGTIANSYFWSSSACDSTGSSGACGSNGTGHASVATFYDHTSAPMSSWDRVNETGDGTNDFWSFNGSSHASLWFESSFQFATTFAGLGTSASPYLIGSVANFNAIGQNPRWMGSHFQLTASLDFNAIPFYRIGGNDAFFWGNFNGNNQTLSNITINTPTESHVGTFGYLTGFGRLENLVLSNVNIVGNWFTGGAVGFIGSGGQLYNIRVTSGSVTGSGYGAGGVFGRSFHGLSHSRLGNSATVTGVENVGGVGGDLSLNLDAANTNTLWYNKGNISGVTRVGGVVGFANWAGTTRDLYSTGSVTATGQYAGGLAGFAGNSTFERGYSTGPVSGTSRVGGAFGSAPDSQGRIFATGAVNGTGGSTMVGYLVGSGTPGTLTHSYYWSGAACDSTGSAGACNTTGTGGQADVTYFHSSANQPLSGWTFPGNWTAVGGTFPRQTWEP